MKKFLVYACAIAAVLAWYGWLVPTAWHADDAAIFGESRKTAAHLGAVVFATIPPLIFAGGWLIAKKFK